MRVLGIETSCDDRTAPGGSLQGAVGRHRRRGRPGGYRGLLKQSPPPGRAEGRRLLQRPGWLMRVTYFAPEPGDGRPTYSFRVHMTDTGIARDMLLDYGSFTLTGTLKALEPLDRPNC